MNPTFLLILYALLGIWFLATIVLALRSGEIRGGPVKYRRDVSPGYFWGWIGAMVFGLLLVTLGVYATLSQ